MTNPTPFLTHRQTVDALSFRHVRKGWRAGVRWLLYKLADWLDATEARIGIKDELDRNTTWKREMKLARWERERLLYFESLRGFVRETMKRGTKADKHGNHRWKRRSGTSTTL